MTKPMPKPGNIETVTRKDIMAMTGLSHNKVITLTLVRECNFPKPVCKLAHGELIYNKAEILTWLQQYDLPAMKKIAQQYNRGENARAACTTPKIKSDNKKPQSFDNEIALTFITGKFAKPINFTNRIQT